MKTTIAITPTNFKPQVLLKAKGIRALLLDVDGVLTDGGLIFGAEGETYKRFNTLDGHGIKLLQRAGITPCVITGRDSAALRARLSALGVRHAAFGVTHKAPEAQAILDALGIDWSQAAAMGDDWPDLPLLSRCALAFVPPTAHHQVLALADHITQANAGHGAVREACDLLLVANDKYARLLAEDAEAGQVGDRQSRAPGLV